MAVQMTTEQYAQWQGVKSAAIRKRIMEGKELPAGVKLSRFGKSHVFLVSHSAIREQKRTKKKVA